MYQYIREEEIKNKVGQDWFSNFDTTKIIGNIDFAITLPQESHQVEIFETESLFWAEAKKGTADPIHSIAQLILTIGKARTFDKFLPPQFLGCFDSETIAFIPYNRISDIFYVNDFNWNVTPSNYQTKEFKLIKEKINDLFAKNTLIFSFQKDPQDLTTFIRQNFVVGKANLARIAITKNNFMVIYNKWTQKVKPTIRVKWDVAKKRGIIDGDFYLADLLSRENETLREKLFVLLKKDKYELNRQIDDAGMFSSQTTTFNDQQKAHHQFWNTYQRPPQEEYWDYIVNRRDLLVPQDIRERKGSYFTPQIWVEKSQEYIADVLGEDWQDEYFIWDCAAGTGNLLAGLTNKYNIFASTLDKQDVDAMHDRIANGANLLPNHCFQFDFLNDDFSKLPKPLKDIIDNSEKRKKLVIYINPPYAEAASTKTVASSGTNKTDVAVRTEIYQQYKNSIGIAGRELFAQFLVRIYKEIPGSIIAQFSTLKAIQGPNFDKFRNYYKAEFKKGFIVPADTFDNVKGRFPIGFMIWKLDNPQKIEKITCDVFSKLDHDKNNTVVKKTFCTNSQTINQWLISTRNRIPIKTIGYISCKGNDFQNNNFIFLINNKIQLPHPRGTWVTDKNLIEVVMYLSVRHCIKATWLNDRDQFLYPHDGWMEDLEFQNDCLAFTLFHGQNRITSTEGVNHWIPFTEAEVKAQERFESHFMTDFINGKTKIGNPKKDEFEGFSTEKSFVPQEPLEFSETAQAIFDAGRALWKYYHQQENIEVNASLYDIKAHFQGRNAKGRMNSKSNDGQYTHLLQNLREALHTLAKKIQPKVYEYGFLKR